jgi:hypothetical protein
MSALYEYHPHNYKMPHVNRPDLVHAIATHALRNVPHAEHILKEVIPSTRWSTQLKPQPYNQNGKMQMIHH